MKKLVIYYSLEGNTKFIAQLIAETIGAETLELKPKGEIKRHGLTKYFWGGRQVMTKEEPELSSFDEQLNDYDVLFIGTPVWAGSYAPALNTLFSNTNFRDKKIALFCCHRGGKGKIFEKMKERLTGNEIMGEMGFRDPLKKDKENHAGQARIWAKEVMAKL